MGNLPPELCDLYEDEQIRMKLTNESYIERQEGNLNILDNFWQLALESCIFRTVLTSEYVKILRGGQVPRSLVLDKNSEELVSPH